MVMRVGSEARLASVNAAPYRDLRQKTESSSRGGARTTRGESQGGGKQLDTNDHLRSGAGIHCAKRELR